MVQRKIISIIKNRLFQGKMILLVGPKQVGKTTLMRQLQADSDKKLLWLNGDEPDIREFFKNSNSSQLRTLLGNNQIVVIDEAQRLSEIGISLKLIVDNFPDIQLLVTGSSSFELRDILNEPLTGRKFEYFLYPFSFQEMVDHTSLIEEKRLLEHRLIYGYYPEIVTKPGDEKELLTLLADSYLYKDIFTYEQIKKPEKIEKLLQALAFQISNEVRYHELGQVVGADNETIERYINILEKAFVVFRLPSLSRNMRNEIRKGRKIYFYDNGIRNSIIRNFNTLSLRQDVGALWENFLISERMKLNHYNLIHCNYFFWRTHTQQEVDFIEERDGKLYGFEFCRKISKRKKIPASFLKGYPEAEVSIIDQENYVDFIMPNY